MIVVVFEEFGLFAFESEACEFPFDVLEDGGGGAGGLFGHLFLMAVEIFMVSLCVNNSNGI